MHEFPFGNHRYGLPVLASGIKPYGDIDDTLKCVITGRVSSEVWSLLLWGEGPQGH